MSAFTAQARRFFDALAPGWDARCQHDPRKVAAIVTLAGVPAGGRVLDIACGTGVLEPALLECAPREILAVDLSPAMIAEARRKLSDPRVRFAACDLFELAETGFDTAVAYSAYPHFPDKARFAAHVAGLLRPGGRLLIAHSQGRAAINAHHESGAAREVSVGLRPAREEAEALRPYFSLDIVADTPEIYVLSGVCRAAAGE